MNNLFHWLVPAAVLCAPMLAYAQGGRADPADTKTSAPALRYHSAFADYKAWQDTKPGDWRALNDSLNAQGGSGHGSHAGHSGHAMPTAASAPVPGASKPAMPAQGEHHKHGSKR
jgi:hypothetical protein